MVGTLDELQDEVLDDPQETAAKQRVEAAIPGAANALQDMKTAQVKRREEAFARYTKTVQEARAANKGSKWDQISQMLIAYGQPSHSKGEALAAAAQAGLNYRMDQKALKEKYGLEDAQLRYTQDIDLGDLEAKYDIASMKQKGAGSTMSVKKAELDPTSGNFFVLGVDGAGEYHNFIVPPGSGASLKAGDPLPADAKPAGAPSGGGAPGLVPKAPITLAAGQDPSTLAPGTRYKGQDGKIYVKMAKGPPQEAEGRSTEDEAKLEGAKKAAELDATALDVLRDQVVVADKMDPLLAEAIGLLDKGLVIAGPLAKAQLAAAKAAGKMGDTKAQERADATERFMNIMGQNVAPLAKQFGAAQSISEGDRKFAEGLAGADITKETKTLRQIAVDMQAGNKYARDRYQKGTAKPTGPYSAKTAKPDPLGLRKGK